MKKPVSRLIIICVLMIIMMGALIYRLGTLTIKEGEAWAKSADNRSTQTIAIKGERGKIMDRNGVVLAYSETCYNVEFLRNADNRTKYDSAIYTESLIKAIDIIEKSGGSTIDASYIVLDENGSIAFDWRISGVESSEAKERVRRIRYKNFCEAMGITINDPDGYGKTPKDPSTWNMEKWPTAEYSYNYLRKNWYIPEEFSFEQANKIISIRQEVALNNYRAYEPVTIAYNVSQEVVSEIVERSDELVGVQIAQSTTRVYPRGETAAHILGYLSKSADTVSASKLVSMGYKRDELKQYYLKDDNGGYILGDDGDYQVKMTDKSGLAYSNDDYIGVSGVEYTMEAYLTGATKQRQGSREVEINKNLSITRELSSTPAKDGDNVMLTVEINLQAKCESALANLIAKMRRQEEELIADDAEKPEKEQKYKGKDIDLAATGAIVVMDPRSGEVLAMASYPSFDPNWFMMGLTTEQVDYLFGDGADKTTPLRNKAISERNAPGSIFKPATGIAGVSEGVVGIEELINDHNDGGYYYFYTRDEDGKVKVQKQGAPRCWSYRDHSAHANINLTQALTFSCNYYFCEIANRMGIDKLNEWIGKFGLDKKTNIELTGEMTGIGGGQKVLFDNELLDDNGELSISRQKTSLPVLIYNSIRERLKEYVTRRSMEIDDAAIRACALRLMMLQDGKGLDGKGPEIRKILSDELGIPEGYSITQNWTSEIVTLLNEIQWKPTQTIRAGFGQGVTLVTPIAVARYVCALANEGTVYDANIVERIVDTNGNLVEDKNADVYARIGDGSAEWHALWDSVKQGLKGVVSLEDHGTAAGGFSEEFRNKYLDRIAGKTGSAQIGINSIDIENTSWFVSYTPREGEAELVIVICIPSGYAGAWSVSAAEEIYTYYFNQQDSAAPETLVDIGGIAP